MRLDLFTLLHPGSLEYFQDLLDSLKLCGTQISLWIATDNISLSDLERYQFGEIEYKVIARPNNVDPIKFRVDVLKKIAHSSDAVMLIDSDDYLIGDRIGRAIKSLEINDAHVCSLSLVSTKGSKLGVLKSRQVSSDICFNTIGLSNLSLRSNVIKMLKSPPVGSRILDWYISLQLLAHNYKIDFDSEVLVAYRQHENNFFSCLAPYQPAKMIQATLFIMGQLTLFAEGIGKEFPGLSLSISKRIDELKLFMQMDDMKHMQYLEILNKQKKVFYWWEAIAYSPLRYLWSTN